MNAIFAKPSEGESLLVDSLYYGIIVRSYELTKRELLNIPKISTFDRINFHLFKKYTFTIVDGVESFEEKLREELKESCRKIIRYCRE